MAQSDNEFVYESAGGSDRGFGRRRFLTGVGAGFGLGLATGSALVVTLGLALVDALVEALRVGLGFAVGVGDAVRRRLGSREAVGLSTAASGWLAAEAG